MKDYRGVNIFEQQHTGSMGERTRVELRAPMTRILDADEVQAAGRDPRQVESYRDDVVVSAKKRTMEAARRAIEAAIDEYKADGYE